MIDMDHCGLCGDELTSAIEFQTGVCDPCIRPYVNDAHLDQFEDCAGIVQTQEGDE